MYNYFQSRSNPIPVFLYENKLKRAIINVINFKFKKIIQKTKVSKMSVYEEVIIDSYSFILFETEEECKKEYKKYLKQKTVLSSPTKVKPIIKPTRFYSIEPRITKAIAHIKSETKDIHRLQKTYGELINEAFSNSNQEPLNLREICQFIAKKYEFYDLNDQYWQLGVKNKLHRKEGFYGIILKANVSDVCKYFPIKKEETKLKQESKEHLQTQSNFLAPQKVEPTTSHTCYHSSEPRRSTTKITDQSRASYIKRPQKTYFRLINEAFINANQKPLSSCEICQFIANKYEFYNLKDIYWQKSVNINLAKTQHFTVMKSDNKSNTEKYFPIKQENEEQNELKKLKTCLKLAEDELIDAKETIEREKKENLSLLDLLRNEFQLKIAETEEQLRIIREILSNYASKCIKEN